MWKPIFLDVECIVCNKTLQKIRHDPREVSRKMVRMASKRARTPNWSPEEKQYLLELIREHKEVVINKSSNGHCEEKDIAWNDILRKLAGKFGIKFTGMSIKKVKTQWQNMKRIARDEIALNGDVVHKYSRQSFEVCNLLDIIKDGVLKKENELNEPTMSTNIEIKTETIDEDTNQPGCSNTNPHQASLQGKVINESLSCDSEITEINDADEPVENQENRDNSKDSAGSMTEPQNTTEPTPNNGSFHTQMQEFLKYSAIEKQLKLKSFEEERQVVRAMRETAELNKIIAEQKLKHIIWINNREMAMYSGEPGSGAGKGGGSGGAIRDAGGAFGKMEAAREDQYFYNKQKEQLAKLKGHLDKEIAFHQEQIKRHEDAIRRHKEQMSGINPDK